MRIQKMTIFVIAVSLFFNCGGSKKQISLDGFIRFAEQNGFNFEEVEYADQSPTRTAFNVTPGRMDIRFEIMQDSKTARNFIKEFNTDVTFVKKAVAQDNTHASEIGWNPEAFANGNVVLFVPLNYVVHYDEAQVLTELFKRY